MRIKINIKYNIGNEVYIVWNTITAYNAFIEGKDISSCVVKTNVLSISDIRFQNNEYIIRYKLDNVFYTVKEEEIFSSKEEANEFLMQEILKKLSRTLENLEKESTKSLDKICDKFNSELNEDIQQKVQITNEIQNLNKLKDNLIRLTTNKRTQF